MSNKAYDTTIISKSLKGVELLADDTEKTAKKASEKPAKGGDAMESANTSAKAAGKTAAGAGADGSGSAPLTRPDSETINGTEYKYETAQASATSNYADHYNAETGENEALKNVIKGKTAMTGKYKKGHYVAKPAVEKTPGSTPTLKELVEENESAPQVTRMQGTLEAPNLVNSIVKNNIFIDGKVHIEDIRQGNIGDCYFLASLLQVIQHEPGRILDIMKVSGSTVTTTLFHKEDGKWVQQDIAVQIGLHKQNGSVKSSHWRIAYDPKTARWSSSVDGMTLKITREDLYEAALWVQCMEQAYMVFSKNYGKYGFGDPANVDLKTGINGGQAQNCMYMFFGDRVKADTVKVTNVKNAEEKVDSLKDNMGVVYTLQKYAQAAKDGKQDMYLMAGISTKESVANLTFYAKSALKEIREVLKKNETEALKKAEKDVQQIYAWSYHYYDTPASGGSTREGETDEYQTKVRDEIDKRTIKLKNNAEFQALENPIFKTMEEAAGVVVMRVTGKKEENNNIFIYSGHAYSVSEVKILGKKGQDLTNEALLLSSMIDPEKSTVTLINPHAKTKASLNESEDRYNDGKFEVSLSSFLNNVGYIRTATVNKK
ncbi:MAG: hypothetical protein IJ165_03835 [Proteobacteria bacterium]|nr:hypothetical protein [Pseudomonadota bacterium]